MFLGLILFYLSNFFCRLFKLMELDSKKFLNVPKREFGLDEQSKANLFEDQSPNDLNKAVIVNIQDLPGQVWDYDRKNERLIKYSFHGGVNQQWRVKLIGQDLVVIKYFSDDKKCLTLLRDLNVFSLRKCQKKKNYKDQKFVVTNKDGIHNAFDGNGLLKKPKKDVKWGKCSTCLPGGFGSVLEKDEPSDQDVESEDELNLESGEFEDEPPKTLSEPPKKKKVQPPPEQNHPLEKYQTTKDKDKGNELDENRKPDDDSDTGKPEIPVGPSTRKGTKMLGDIIDKNEDLDKETNPDQDSKSSENDTLDILRSDANPSTFPIIEVKDHKETLCRIKYPNMALPGSRNKKIPFALHVYKKVAE